VKPSREGFGTATTSTTSRGRQDCRCRPDLVSTRALERGSTQIRTLGSGNHFAEVSVSRSTIRERRKPSGCSRTR
jgi:RNA-splicing ligase RtcB